MLSKAALEWRTDSSPVIKPNNQGDSAPLVIEVRAASSSLPVATDKEILR
jgi:hypothetical protein